MSSVITIHNLQFGYLPKNPLFNKPFSFSLPSGVLCGLVGANGIGKSTFLKTLAGLIPSLSGEIEINNQPIKKLNPSLRARNISFIHSNTANFPDIDTMQIVEMGRFPYVGWIHNLRKYDREKCRQAMELTQTLHLKNKTFHTLSDGEKQRIVLAMALAQDTPIILMDEPMAFLDLPAQTLTYQIISDMAYHLNKTIIFSTHDIKKAIKSCDYIIMITKDEIIANQTDYLGLTHEFEKLFAHAHLLFNNQEMNYYSSQLNKAKTIIYHGNSNHVFWTQQFFERMQINPSCNFSLPNSVIVDKTENGNLSWILHYESNSFTCFSFTEIMNTIKEYELKK